MPENPLLAVYVLGCYGWLLFVLAGIMLRPDAFEMLVRESGISRRAFMVAVVLAWSVFWPITICAMLADIVNDRRGR
jgi:hypothetical protein